MVMRLHNSWLNALLFVALASGVSVRAANLPADWQHEQHFDASAAGLVKMSLPVETLGAARPALEDLRLYDDAGNELPYLVERPKPSAKVIRPAKSFQVSLIPNATVITLETGLTQPIDGVTLESPSTDFIKSVRIEGSPDGANWQAVADGRLIFHQPNGASQLRLILPVGAWPWLRLTVDDGQRQPVPFTGAQIYAADAEAAPEEPVQVAIGERNENPGETRLALNLGAANLDIANLEIECPDPLFTRPVTLSVPQVAEDAVREESVGRGTIYRVAIENQPASANLSVALEMQIRSRELMLFVHNQDSPPLAVTALRATRRPVYLLFIARSPGVHHLLTGNSRCSAPRYDLASMASNLKSAAVSPIKLSPLADNPSYRAPEALPGVQAEGTALDVSEWKYRKSLKLTRDGAQQLELDLDTLSHAQHGLGDLRLLYDGKQVPYILEHTSVTRSLAPSVTATTDAKDKKLSRWIIKLPNANLPVTRLSCVAQTPLFRREVSLYEEVADERGDKHRVDLGRASWQRTPEQKSGELVLILNSAPRTDTLSLETYDGDNPPITLDKFQLVCPATRLVFKARAEEKPYLYYGNPSANSPRYDLSLVAGQLFASDKASASAGAEEQLKKSSWTENRVPGKGGVVFWGVLALVVVVLLIIISRLFPQSSPPPTE